jgi:hypothetical protein
MATNKNNHDYTANKRMKRRYQRIIDSGLCEGKVVMHKEHTEEVRLYAKKLYESAGFELKKE